jgi:hypothetical protein
VAILQRRYRDTDWDFSAPTGNKISLALRPFLPRRVSFSHQIDEPWLAFKDLLKGLGGRGGGRNLGEDFGRFVEKRNFALEVDGDYTVIEIAEDLLPGYLCCRASFRLAGCLHKRGQNGCEIIADTDSGAMVRGRLAPCIGNIAYGTNFLHF